MDRILNSGDHYAISLRHQQAEKHFGFWLLTLQVIIYGLFGIAGYTAATLAAV